MSQDERFSIIPTQCNDGRWTVTVTDYLDEYAMRTLYDFPSRAVACAAGKQLSVHLEHGTKQGCEAQECAA